MMDAYFIPILIAGAFAGLSIGLLSVFIVGMRMPFIGSCISHAAMVGAVYASLFQVNPTLGALVLSILAAAGVAFIHPHRRHFDANTGQAILLAFMMGLVFLAVALEEGSRTEMLGLLWGSILFADWGTVVVTGGLAVLLVAFVIAFEKELKAVLFSRSLAAVTSAATEPVYLAFLCFCGLILAVNLKAVGGLLIFSLLVCPAAAAYQVCRGYRSVLLAATGFGAMATTLGFLGSYVFNLPTGACTVIVGTLIFGACSLVRRALAISE
ncbi:MAG TPA: metal ABC transporter permease [Phycisphaerales bacterium]|nr:metal ABC transporter permease [Phycisphaerales bacterium]